MQLTPHDSREESALRQSVGRAIKRHRGRINLFLLLLSAGLVVVLAGIVSHRYGAEPIAEVTPFPRWLITVVIAAFLVTSLTHAFRNLLTGRKRRREAIETAYYIATFFFAFPLVFFCWASPPSFGNELLVAAVLIILLHLLRWSLDYAEARARKAPPGTMLHRTARQFRDAVANLAIVGCALACSAARDHRLVYWAIALSVLLIARELKLRIFDVLFNRPDAEGKWEGAMGEREIPFHLAAAQIFLGKFLKSMVYIGIGFALLFENLALIDRHSVSLVIRGESGNTFIDYLYFSLGMIHHNAYGDVTPVSALAKTLAGLEQIISSILLTVVVALLVESLTSRYRNKDTPTPTAPAAPAPKRTKGEPKGSTKPFRR